jgi:hypothetical protein
LVVDDSAAGAAAAAALGESQPGYTPLSGSWLNLAESIQRIIGRRALAGTHMESSDQTIEALEATVRGWNRCPTPFTWAISGRHAEIVPMLVVKATA